MTKIKGVIFDMDGLIFDSEMLYYEGTQIIADEMKIPYDKDLYLEFLGRSDEVVWAGYHELYDEKFGAAYVQEFIQRAYDKTIEMFEAGEAKLKPGIHELLGYLDDQKIQRVIASSNKRRVIEILLAKAGLTSEFSQIVSAEDVTHAKPSPEIFELARTRLALEKEQVVVLEDSQNGILAAEAAGIPVIMIPDLLPPDETLQRKTVAVLKSLAEVPLFLDNF